MYDHSYVQEAKNLFQDYAEGKIKYYNEENNFSLVA